MDLSGDDLPWNFERHGNSRLKRAKQRPGAIGERLGYEQVSNNLAQIPIPAGMPISTWRRKAYARGREKSGIYYHKFSYVYTVDGKSRVLSSVPALKTAISEFTVTRPPTISCVGLDPCCAALPQTAIHFGMIIFN
jgi:hypothetical protein